MISLMIDTALRSELFLFNGLNFVCKFGEILTLRLYIIIYASMDTRPSVAVMLALRVLGGHRHHKERASPASERGATPPIYGAGLRSPKPPTDGSGFAAAIVLA